VIRILVVDDAEVIRRVICRALSARPECQVVSDVSNVISAVEKAKEHQPDVVLLDISMPELNGLQAIPLIKKVAPRSEILIITQHNNRFFVGEAFAQGARGFLHKGDLGAELYEAVIEVLLKKRFLSTSVRAQKFGIAAGGWRFTGKLRGFRKRLGEYFRDRRLI
jgi:two-component system, NarL family, response regulator NreC